MTTPIRHAVRRRVPCTVPHGIRPELILTIYPNGILGLREKGRRLELVQDAGALYAKLLAAHVRRGQRRGP